MIMHRRLMFFIVLSLFAWVSHAEELSSLPLNTLRGVDLVHDADTFAVTYNFAEETKIESAVYTVNEDHIEVKFNGTNMASDKNQQTSNGVFREITTAPGQDNSIISKLYFKEKNVKPIAVDAIKLDSQGHNLVLKIENAAVVAAVKPSNKMPKIESLKEADIPVLANAKSNKPSSEVSSSRIIFGLFVILIMSVGLIYFSRWYAQRNKKSTDPNRIRILSQHYLGPRKSLAIVRVAGESLLLGVTDQNISMIKSLAMLDEEEAETGISSFKNTLMNSNREPVEDDFATQTVADKITSRLKGMRNI